MFIEPKLDRFKAKAGTASGSIEVICGSVFSGKTEELIRRLNRAVIAKQEVEIFKSAINTKYDSSNVASHNSSSVRFTLVQLVGDILLLAGDS